MQALEALPDQAAAVLGHAEDRAIRRAADGRPVRRAGVPLPPGRDVLYIGRGIQYPIALEGALKLKEISYIHAEGYPAGEMKHGPIALIDRDVPVVAIALRDRVYEKMLSNIQEARRAGRARSSPSAPRATTALAAVADHVICRARRPIRI